MKNHSTKAFTLIELLVVIVTVAVLAVLLVPALAKTKANDLRINCVYNLKQVGLSFRLWGQSKAGRYPMGVAPAFGGPLAGQAATATTSMNTLAGATAATFTYQIFQVMSNELGTPKIVACPSDGDRSARLNFGGPTGAGADFVGNVAVSYFVGKDADESSPQRFLCGDRNIGVKPASGWSGTSSPGGVTGFSPNSSSSGSYQSLGNYTNNVNLQWTDKLHQAKGNICLADGSVQQYNSVTMRTNISNSGDTTAFTYFP